MPNIKLFPQHTYLLRNYNDSVKLIISINPPYNIPELTSLIVQVDENGAEVNRTNKDGSPFTYEVKNIPNGGTPIGAMPTQPKDKVRIVTEVLVPPGIDIPIELKYQLKQGESMEDYKPDSYTPEPATVVTFQAELDFA